MIAVTQNLNTGIKVQIIALQLSKISVMINSLLEYKVNVFRVHTFGTFSLYTCKH